MAYEMSMIAIIEIFVLSCCWNRLFGFKGAANIIFSVTVHSSAGG